MLRPSTSLRRAVKMALERRNCQLLATFLLASLPYGKLERTARFIITLTMPFLQSAPALTRLPWANVLKVVRHCKQERPARKATALRRNSPQTASIYRARNTRSCSLPGRTRKWARGGWNGAAVRLLFLLVGKNRQSSSYSANSLLFVPQKKCRRKPQFPTAIIPP